MPLTAVSPAQPPPPSDLQLSCTSHEQTVAAYHVVCIRRPINYSLPSATNYITFPAQRTISSNTRARSSLVGCSGHRNGEALENVPDLNSYA